VPTNRLPKPEPVTEVADDLRNAIARLARRMRQEGPSALGPSHTAALANIRRHGPLTHRELATLERVAPPSITAIVNRLEELSLVTRASVIGDRRASAISISASGIEQLEGLREHRTEWLGRRLALLTAEERRALASAVPILTWLSTVELDHDL
jgi:DNA-binding MarR family transcriptional regulator